MNENKSLYFFEGIACLLVVFVHASLSGFAVSYICSLATFVVPFFFMLSGFYLYPALGTPNFSAKIKSRFLRNLALTALAMAVYIAYDLIVNIAGGLTLRDIAAIYFSSEHILPFLIYNDVLLTTYGTSPFHLWYLFTLLYVYIILFFAGRLLTQENVKKVGVGVIAFMLAKCIFNYVLTCLNVGGTIYTVSDILLSAEWINGTCYMILGMSLRAFLKSRTLWLENKKPLIVVAIFALAAIKLAVNKLTEAYAPCAYTSVLCVVAGSALPFIYAGNDRMKSSNLLVKLGKELSLDIYVWHMLVIWLVYACLNSVSISSTLYNCLLPILVFAGTIAFCILLRIYKRPKRAAKSEKC